MAKGEMLSIEPSPCVQNSLSEWNQNECNMSALRIMNKMPFVVLIKFFTLTMICFKHRGSGALC